MMDMEKEKRAIQYLKSFEPERCRIICAIRAERPKTDEEAQQYAEAVVRLDRLDYFFEGHKYGGD